MRPLTPKPFLQGMSRGETRSNRSDIKTDGKASKDLCDQRHHHHDKREECTQNLRQMHSENFFDYEMKSLIPNLFYRECQKEKQGLLS